MNRRRLMQWLAIAAVILLCAIAWRATHEQGASHALARASTPVAYQQPATPDDEGRSADAVAHAHEQAERRAATRDLDRARRDALHERILERERVRRMVADHRSGGEGGREAERANDDPGLENRMGAPYQAIVDAVNAELMPLADECVDQATARAPSLRGMLAMSIAAVGDDELGAVIEDVGFPSENQIRDPELLECLRESSLTMSLPPPPEDGRTAFEITMRIGEES